MTNATSKRINVTTTAYEGDQPFPEAEHYPDYVQGRLHQHWPDAEISVETGPKTDAHVHGFGAEEDDVKRDVLSLVKVDLWDDFCGSGYKDFDSDAS